MCLLIVCRLVMLFMWYPNDIMVECLFICYFVRSELTLVEFNSGGIVFEMLPLQKREEEEEKIFKISTNGLCWQND